MNDYPRAIAAVDQREPVPRRVRAVLGGLERDAAARVYVDGSLEGYARFEWDALDAWYEEDEQVFVHPRNPYTRVDALRSTRHVGVEWSPVLLFETGLPSRYYLDRTAVIFGALERSATVTACPYKGRTTDYWSVRTPGGLHPDLAWSYSFPTAACAPIAGLVAFYHEKVGITVDGRPLE